MSQTLDINIYILSDKKLEGAMNIPLLDIVFIQHDIEFTKYDGLIFTSKNAVYSLENFKKKWQEIPSYAISEQTATSIKKYNGNLHFTGKDGHGDAFALELLETLKNKKLLYLRGEKVVSNIAKILNNNGIECEESIVYKTQCKTQKEKVNLTENSRIIFSSPSTIQCFFENYTWNESYRAICIGKTTAKYLPKYITPYIADKTSLQSCIVKAKEIS